MSRTRMHVWTIFRGLAMGGEPMRSAAAGRERVHPHARIALDPDRRPPARRRVACDRAPRGARPGRARHVPRPPARARVRGPRRGRRRRHARRGRRVPRRRPGAGARRRVDARDVRRAPRGRRPLAAAAGVGHGPPLAQLGAGVRRARPGAAAGRDPAARGARLRARPPALRQLARARRSARDRRARPAARALPGPAFKVDAQATWSPELTAAVAGTGAVDVVDFKGRYGLPVEDEFALLAMYEAVLERFDDAILEDPHDRPDVAALIEPHAARVSFDAPIATAGDIERAAFRARTVNVKPSRIGSLRALSDIYALCAREGIAMYGGGMGEIGVARGQIELLAALFHPDRPNDVAPSAYNLADLPDGLPESPLTPPGGVAGFRWG